MCLIVHLIIEVNVVDEEEGKNEEYNGDGLVVMRRIIMMKMRVEENGDEAYNNNKGMTNTTGRIMKMRITMRIKNTCRPPS